ncbi:MAG: hypothetical protein U5O16_02890 [Rhodococcus sp. (in: high G+C Gram-positive bacteria)]|uniref:hypothetical protein n=1 Tax=Rhodococcus sp. TaxID=1831 RepID=UPI002AD5D0C8|nr:hypothetical protein [Rhodococcus sp. (in: high G+C Gram-positive bacteria)]
MSTTFFTNRGDLTKAITIALKFAGKDDTLPMLHGIDLQILRSRFVIASTDRFRGGVVRLPVVDDLTGGDQYLGHLSRGSATRILKVFGGGRALERSMRVQVTADRTTLTVSDGETSITVTFTGEKFPNLAEILLIEMERPIEVENWMANSAYLAAFKDAAWSPNQAVSIRLSTPSRPAVIRIGDHFIGILMPVRAGTDRDPVSDWKEFLTPTPEPEKPKRAPRKKVPAKAAAKAPAKRAPTKRAAAKKTPVKRASRAAK